METPRKSAARQSRKHKKDLLEEELEDCKEEVYQRRQQEEYLECLLQGLTHHASRVRADALPNPFHTTTSSVESDNDGDSSSGTSASTQEVDPTPEPEEDNARGMLREPDPPGMEVADGCGSGGPPS